MKTIFRNDKRRRAEQGFSILEVAVVVAITLVVSAMAIPSLLNATHTFRLRNASSEFAGLLQQARSRSVRDSTYYGVDIVWTSPITKAFVDLDKNSTLDETCTSDKNCDPFVSWAPEVEPQPQSSAPDRTSLQNLFLTGSTGVTPVDGSLSSTAITFSPMGLPCVTTTSGGSTVCNTTGGLVAYWIFFQNNVNQQWEAVTVTPAGKIQKWSHTGSWAAL